MKVRLLKTMIAGLFICLSFNSVSAQTFLFQSFPTDRSQIGLKYIHPFFDAGDDFDLSTFSGVYDLYGNFPVASKINVAASIPYMTMNYESGYGTYDEAGIGNIYIGMQYRLGVTDYKSSNIAFGIFIPTASDVVDKYELYILSLFTNYYESHKYLPNTLTLYGNYAYRYSGHGGSVFGLEIGPHCLIPTEGDGDETEIFVHYGLIGGLQLTNLAIFAELVGLAILTEEVDDFSDRFIHDLTVGVQWLGWTFRPGVFYRIYLDEDFRDVVSGRLGVKVEAVF